MISSTRRALAASALAASLLAMSAATGAPALAAEKPKIARPKAVKPATDITERDVRTAQEAWAEALKKIGREYEAGGPPAAKAAAEIAINKIYGYNLGPVLFKPTLTRDPQTFRLTRAGALSYFVDDDKANFPDDKGFALDVWRSVEITNIGILYNRDVAIVMSRVVLKDKNPLSKPVVVDKTWSFKKVGVRDVRIIAHHSSLANLAPIGQADDQTGGKKE